MKTYLLYCLLFVALVLIYLKQKYNTWSNDRDIAERLDNVYIVPEHPTDENFWVDVFKAIPDGVVFLVPKGKVNLSVRLWKEKLVNVGNELNVQVIGFIFRDVTTNQNTLHESWEEFRDRVSTRIITNRSSRHLTLKRKSKEEYDYFLNNQKLQ